jgi:VanZ family protein
MVVIYLFSDQPHSGRETAKILGDFNIAVRKCAHLTEYAVLFALCKNAWSHSFERTRLWNLSGIGSLTIAISYALTDEWHQSFVPGRSATISDVLVDSSGALIGWLVWLILVKLFVKPGSSCN